MAAIVAGTRRRGNESIRINTVARRVSALHELRQNSSLPQAGRHMRKTQLDIQKPSFRAEAHR
jgi:hypothetical protein